VRQSHLAGALLNWPDEASATPSSQFKGHFPYHRADTNPIHAADRGLVPPSKPFLVEVSEFGSELLNLRRIPFFEHAQGLSPGLSGGDVVAKRAECVSQMRNDLGLEESVSELTNEG
jgi:hypothetical protein